MSIHLVTRSFLIAQLLTVLITNCTYGRKYVISNSELSERKPSYHPVLLNVSGKSSNKTSDELYPDTSIRNSDSFYGFPSWTYSPEPVRNVWISSSSRDDLNRHDISYNFGELMTGQMSNYHPQNYFPQPLDEDFSSIDDSLLLDTLAGAKLLKFGKIIVVLFMLLIVFILGELVKAGVALSPIVLPLALIPLGIAVLLPSITPFIAGGIPLLTGRGEKRKRRRRKRNNFASSSDEEALTMSLLKIKSLKSL